MVDAMVPVTACSASPWRKAFTNLQSTTGVADQTMSFHTGVSHRGKDGAQRFITPNRFKNQGGAIENHLGGPGIEAIEREGHRNRLIEMPSPSLDRRGDAVIHCHH